MARVTGPSRDELDARGDEFAARVTRAIRTTLRDVAATTRDVDDLTRIQTVWNSVVRHALAPHLRATWNTAVEGVRGQLEKINDRQRETLVAAVFEIPKVSNPLAEAFLADATNRLIAIGDVVWYTARGEMLTGLQLGEGVAELKKRVVESANVSSKQAEVIARTEVNSAMNNGAYQQMKALDVPTVKEWIAASDSRTRKSHADVDGEEIAGDAKFMVGGSPMDHPHDLNAPPGETINCRCTLAWEIADNEDDYEDELVAAGVKCTSFHLEGKHDQSSHGRDRPNKAKDASEPKKGPTKPKIQLKDWKAAKKASGSGAGKPLKITHMLVHKAHGEPGTILTENGAGDKRVVWDGDKYRLQRKTESGSWTTEKTAIKSKAYVEVNAYDNDWRVPSTGGQESDSESEPGLIDEPALTPATPSTTSKPTSKSVKITKDLVSQDYKPGEIVVINSDKNKRAVWDGEKYQLQAKADDGSWLTVQNASKSDAHTKLKQFDGEDVGWNTPAQGQEMSNVIVSDIASSEMSAPNTPGVSLKSMDDLTFVVKEKKGAVFSDKSNLKWLVTPTQSESHARNQFLAANLYNFAGVNVESTDIVAIDPAKFPNTAATVGVKTIHAPGELGLVDSMKKFSKTKELVNENFAIDAWLGNWDVVGIGYENIAVDKYGVPKRTNIGGSLLYRANGTPKGAAFGNTVGEIDSLRNPHINAASAKVFADVTDDDIRAGVAKLEKLSPATIDFVVEQSGFTGAEATKLKNTLKARRQDLIDKYGSNAPKPAATPNTPATSTQPTASNVFGGTKTYTPSQKAKVQSIFAKHNLKWFNKTDAIYDAAHEVSTTHPDLTMGDALDIMDQSLKKKTGNPFRTKVEKFLKTKAGKNHALVKGGSASLGGTTPKVSPTPAPTSPTKTTGNKYVDHGDALPKVLSRTTAGILQQRMNEASPPPWTTKQRDSLRTYTGGSYTSINKCARGVTACTPAMKAHLDNIKTAMKPSTDDVVVYRKTNAKSFGLQSPADMTSLVGKTIGDDGVISTSIKSNMWSGQLHLEIEAPKGSMMAWVQPISQHPVEDEMVVAPGTYYEVVSVEKDPYYSDTYKVKLRIIPGSDAQSREQSEKLKTQQAIAALKTVKEGAK
jgi:SPP1 gp7 family putative phage head morphogenesis protein